MKTLVMTAVAAAMFVGCTSKTSVPAAGSTSTTTPVVEVSTVESRRFEMSIGRLLVPFGYSDSDSKIANLLLEKFYMDETGIDIREIRNLRTKREFLWLKDCICPGIKFKTRKLRDLKFEIANTFAGTPLAPAFLWRSHEHPDQEPILFLDRT